MSRAKAAPAAPLHSRYRAPVLRLPVLLTAALGRGASSAPFHSCFVFFLFGLVKEASSEASADVDSAPKRPQYVKQALKKWYGCLDSAGVEAA